MAKKKSPAAPPAPLPLRLDLGCGKNKAAGFLGVDSRKFDGVDVVCNLAKGRWPWKDASVDEARASHFVEHLAAAERIHFVNELWRVLKPGGKAQITTPHWCASRAYGDLTHQWPPVTEFWFFYLSAEWREKNAPHNDAYTCDFQVGYGYNVAPWLNGRNEEFKNFALTAYKEAAEDIVATLTKPAAKGK